MVELEYEGINGSNDCVIKGIISDVKFGVRSFHYVKFSYFLRSFVKSAQFSAKLSFSYYRDFCLEGDFVRCSCVTSKVEQVILD